MTSCGSSGAQLQTAQGTYDSAMNTLTRGKGNLISQANRFVALGVRVKKTLPKTVRDRAEVDDGVDAELDDAGENGLDLNGPASADD